MEGIAKDEKFSSLPRIQAEGQHHLICVFHEDKLKVGWIGNSLFPIWALHCADLCGRICLCGCGMVPLIDPYIVSAPNSPFVAWFVKVDLGPLNIFPLPTGMRSIRSGIWSNIAAGTGLSWFGWLFHQALEKYLSPLLLHCSFSLINACRTQLPPPIGHSLFSPALYLHSGWWLIWEPKQHRPVTCLGHCSCTLSSAPWGTYPETSLDWLSGKQITWLASHAEARASPAWLLLPRPASSAPHACAPGSQQLFLNARPELCTEVH